MEKKNIFKRICLIVAITSIFLCNIPTAIVLSEEEKRKIEYTTPLIGGDGKVYNIKGTRKSLLYDKDGNKSYSDFTVDYNIGSFKINKDNKNKYGFCIEWGRDFENNKAYTSVSPEKNNYINKLPSEVREGIKLATLYGWKQNSASPIKGCNSNDWYIATQIIIWEYQQGIRKSPDRLVNRNGMEALYFKNQIANRPAEKVYNKILLDIKNHNVLPSFANIKEESAPVNVMKYDDNALAYSIKLSDTNNYNKSIKLVENKGISFTKEGNVYTFSSKVPIKTQVLLTLKNKLNNDDDFLVWVGNGSDQRISTGTIDELLFYSKFRTEEKGVCTIIKTSEDNVIEGINFEISGEKIKPQKVVTHSNGKISIDVYPGTYTVREITEKDYLKQEAQTVTIREGEEKNVEFHNILKKGKVEIIKKDADTKDPLENCNIEILDNDKKKIYEGITNEKGLVIFNQIPVGEYYFKEVKAPQGYEIDEKLHELKIVEDGQVIKREITNKKIKPVQTGDNNKKWVLVLLFTAGMAVAGHTLIKYKK